MLTLVSSRYLGEKMRLSFFDSVESRNAFYDLEKNVTIPWVVLTAWRAFHPPAQQKPAIDPKTYGALGMVSELIKPCSSLVMESPGVQYMLLNKVIPPIAVFETYRAAKSYCNACLLRSETPPVLLTLSDDFVIEESGLSYQAQPSEYRFGGGPRRMEKIMALMVDVVSTACVGIILAYEKLVQASLEPPAL